jgi:hypothetical protein
MAIINKFDKNEDPPKLKKGKFVPLLGKRPETTPKFKKAPKEIINV